MGWIGHELPTPGWQLFTRGGTCGVYVQKRKDGEPESEEVEIPHEMLRMLVAEDVRNERISVLEDMGDDEVLGLAGRV